MSNTNNNELPWNGLLNEFDQEAREEDLLAEGGDHDTVSDETVTENGEESDESFDDENVRVLNPSDEHVPVSTLLSGLQEMSSQESNSFRSC